MSDSELEQQMQQLTRAQLVEPQSLDEYAFRHALTREAVYTTLLVRDRRRYHLAVAEAMERTHAVSLDAQSAALSYHYYEAGAWAQTLLYARLAGEKAQAMYAPREAIQHFGRALVAAAQLGQPAPASLHRARGQAYETIGDFEHARADFEASLHAGRAAGERRAEWQALVDLGFLWASRNYARTGEYLRQSVDQAYKLGEPAVIAQSLNRLGNWYANVEQPAEALRHHREALTIFESLGDQPGLAATLDLLALASAFACDGISAERYFRRAIALFRELGDRIALSSAQASLAQGSIAYFNGLSIASDTLTSTEGLVLVEEALVTARAIGLRAGEAYALLTRALVHGSRGTYTEALTDAYAGLAIALEIEHQQWAANAELLLGVLYLDLMAYDRARMHLQRGLVLARAVGSIIFERAAVGSLGMVAAQRGSARVRAQAAAAIGAALGDDGSDQAALPASDVSLSLWQRLCWQARADLAVANGKPRVALLIMDRLVQRLPQRELASKRPPSLIAFSRALALARLAQPANARTAEKLTAGKRSEERISESELREGVAWVQAVQANVLTMESPPLQMRLHVALGRLYRAQRFHAEARNEFASAREIVARLAEQIGDEELRRNYLAAAKRMIPAPAKYE